jgi:hypothetical protein
MEFAGQGTAILVLWREIAWKDDKPKDNFFRTGNNKTYVFCHKVTMNFCIHPVAFHITPLDSKKYKTL